MDEARKRAYRHLLYQAMLDIRPLEWITHDPLRLLNPFKLWRILRLATEAGALAYWLHNLAHYSELDFATFDEQQFWSQYEALKRRYPGSADHYRQVFDRHLSDARNA